MWSIYENTKLDNKPKIWEKNRRVSVEHRGKKTWQQTRNPETKNRQQTQYWETKNRVVNVEHRGVSVECDQPMKTKK